MAVLQAEAKLDAAGGKKCATMLSRRSNQALGLGRFALSFLDEARPLGPGPNPEVLQRVELFHTDAVVCGMSALALRCNAPTILREEALELEATQSSQGATVFGSDKRVLPEKAICANGSAVREWDSNGTVFGYNNVLGDDHKKGEFGHNDFYGVVIAACQMRKLDGRRAALAMVLLDEIRGRLAEVFSLKSYKIDHVVHGAIASAVTYGALMGATAEQIESAIGMVVAHYIPWRAIRAGHQLSDSKGASAALSTEVAILSMKRAMRGFIGPKDIFRNPQAIFRYFEPTASDDESPFDLVLSHSGRDFAVMGMHFKLGLYEHQSAGALHALIELLLAHPHEMASSSDSINEIKIVAYEPAFSIIGDAAKHDPTTRQSADHSMVFIVARLLRKAMELGSDALSRCSSTDELWKQLLLTPDDYSKKALVCPQTRELMQKISFAHGGSEYDSKYPDGIPTSVVCTTSSGDRLDSGLVMYPAGHARNTTADLDDILRNKFERLASLAVEDPHALIKQLTDLPMKSYRDLNRIYSCELQLRDPID